MRVDVSGGRGGRRCTIGVIIILVVVKHHRVQLQHKKKKKRKVEISRDATIAKDRYVVLFVVRSEYIEYPRT